MSPRVAIQIFVLRYVRAAGIPLLTAVLGLLFLSVPAQTSDLLANLDLRHSALFHVAVGFWAVTIWYWARWCISAVPAIEPEGTVAVPGLFDRTAEALRRWIPRLPVFFVLPAVLIPVLRSAVPGERQILHATLALLVTTGLMLFVLYRPRRVPRLARGRREIAVPVMANADRLVNWSDLLRILPFGWGVAALWPLGFVAMALAFHAAPVRAGHVLGAPATAFLGLALLSGSLSLVAGLLRHGLGVPGWVVIGAVLVFGAADHAVRALPPQGQEEEGRAPYRLVSNRPTLGQALDDWRATCAEDSPRGPRFVIVATAGGASRAALWTAEVLSRMEDMAPVPFRRAMFGISGVSGGSLGAAAFVAGLSARACGEAEDGADRAARHRHLRDMLRTELLAPPIGALLTTDVLSRVLPFVSLRDRAVALESAFQAAWNGGPSEPRRTGTGFDSSFLSLWMTGGDAARVDAPVWRPGRPLLLLNGTLGETGIPVLTAPVRVTQDQFPLALDALQILGRDIRVSTAVTNSARFPLVSPSGVLRGRDGERAGAVVDGGYTENFGADTARDLVRAVAYWQASRSADAAGASPPRPRPVAPRVLVVQISSDPSLPREAVPRCGPRPERFLPIATAETRRGMLDDVLGPLTAVLAARGARGARTAGDLAREFCADASRKDQPLTGRFGEVQTNYVHFALCDEDIPKDGSQQAVVGLNWALTPAAVDFLFPARPDGSPTTGADGARARAWTACGNVAEGMRVRDWLLGRGGASGGAAPTTPVEN